MNLINALVYLALMFYLGTGAVIDTEPKISEDGMEKLGRFLEEAAEKYEANRMVEDKEADIDTLNEELTTDVSENDLENVKGMACRWRGNIGACCVHIRHLPTLCVSMIIIRTSILVKVTVGHHVLYHHLYRGRFSKSINFRYGPVHVSFRMALVSFTRHSLKLCFSVSYSIFFHHHSYGLGCTTKHFVSDENSPSDNMDDVIENAKEFLAFQGIAAEKLTSSGSHDEEKQSENPLVWKMNS